MMIYPWSFRSSNGALIATVTGSIHLAAVVPFFSFLPPFPALEPFPENCVMGTDGEEEGARSRGKNACVV